MTYTTISVKYDCHVLVNKNVKNPANQLGRKCALAF
jgi:hypothetical protein